MRHLDFHFFILALQSIAKNDWEEGAQSLCKLIKREEEVPMEKCFRCMYFLTHLLKDPNTQLNLTMLLKILSKIRLHCEAHYSLNSILVISCLMQISDCYLILKRNKERAATLKSAIQCFDKLDPTFQKENMASNCELLSRLGHACYTLQKYFEMKECFLQAIRMLNGVNTCEAHALLFVCNVCYSLAEG